MSVDELLSELNIDKEPEENENGSWTIDLDNSTEYDRYASKLRKAEDRGILEEDQEASQAGIETSSIQYVSEDEDLVLTLLANFDLDEYKLIIREL